MEFDKVWADLINIIEHDNVIFTLQRKCPNEIVERLEEGLVVVTSKGTSVLVEKEWIKVTWEILFEKKCLRVEDIPLPGRFRSSFIIALLSTLAYVSFKLHPLTLYMC